MKVATIISIPLELASHTLRAIPGRIGVFLRRFAYRFFIRDGRLFDIFERVEIYGLGNLSIGDGTCIESGCTLLCANAPLAIGRGSYLNKNVRLGSGGDASFSMGNHVMIGPNVVMDTSQHNMDRVDVPMKKQGLSCSPILVEDDVWIGANSVVLAGVTLGQGCVVGAGSVVTRDVPPFAVVVGAPARIVRYRGEERKGV